MKPNARPAGAIHVVRQHDLHPEHSIATEAGVDAAEMIEAVDQEARRDRKHECKRIARRRRAHDRRAARTRPCDTRVASPSVLRAVARAAPNAGAVPHTIVTNDAHSERERQDCTVDANVADVRDRCRQQVRPSRASRTVRRATPSAPDAMAITPLSTSNC